MIGRFASESVKQELFQKKEFYICLLAGVLALISHLINTYSSDIINLSIILAWISVIVNGFPIIFSAAKGVWKGKINVDELISIALIASIIQGEILTAAIVSFVMTLGGLIEEAAGESARKSIKSLMAISPKTAIILKDEKEKIIPVKDLEIDDIVLIKPGDRICADAVIVSGITAVDESSMTGEPLPIDKKAGDTILAGTLNHNGVIQAKVIRIGKDTTLGKIISLVSQAEKHKPKVARLVDRLSTWFTPTILSLAGITYFLTGSIDRAVAVLIVGCPCALILAAPTATVAAIARAAKSGILVKGGQYLEQAGKIKAVFFDKTGTLTIGQPRVEEVDCAKGVDKKILLALASSAESNCGHPLAKAVIMAAQYAKVALQKAEEVFTEIGHGVKAKVNGSLIEVVSASSYPLLALPLNLETGLKSATEKGSTPILVFKDQAPIGLLSVSDKVRPIAKETIKDLASLGIDELAIISGDHKRSVENVAQKVGISNIYSSQTPQNKLEAIDSYQKKGLKVMYVGDGINDAPALAKADLGVAMGKGGTDVALETADIALTHDDIASLPFLIQLSRRMVKIIKWNIFFSFIFNSLAILLSGTGYLSPIQAAVLHNLGTLMVVACSSSLAFFSYKHDLA